MRAVAYLRAGPIDTPDSLVDVDVPAPQPGPRDLLVEVHAVSVNPVDTKQRAGVTPKAGEARILGFDASGVVVETGAAVTLFRPGDHVYYAGSIARAGSNAQLQIVDERIVGRKPATLSHAQAAALPLTTITAWEALFDRLRIHEPVPGAAPAIVIIGAAGGVGSIAIQLVRRLSSLTVIGTASRPESRAWVSKMGAHHVIDHRQPLAAQLRDLGIASPGLVFATFPIRTSLTDLAEFMAPQGRLALINIEQADFSPLMRKCISIHWEAMFTRALFETADMEEQHRLLSRVAETIDTGSIVTTMTQHLGTICALNLQQAHALVESRTTLGKIVLEGFPSS